MVFRTAAIMLLLAACAGDYERPGTCTVGEHRACTTLGGEPGLATCGDAAPALWSSCVVFTTPLARANGPASLGYHQQVALDGSLSIDPQQLPLTYAWTFVSRPPGSAAVLDDPTSATPSFYADVVGTYAAQLVIDDGHLKSAAAMIVVEAHDDAPVVPQLASSRPVSPCRSTRARRPMRTGIR